MAKIAKDQASQVEKMEVFEGYYEDLGGYTLGFTPSACPTTAASALPLRRRRGRHRGRRGVLRPARPHPVVELSPTAELARTIGS